MDDIAVATACACRKLSVGREKSSLLGLQNAVGRVSRNEYFFGVVLTKKSAKILDRISPCHMKKYYCISVHPASFGIDE